METSLNVVVNTLEHTNPFKEVNLNRNKIIYEEEIENKS